MEGERDGRREEGEKRGYRVTQDILPTHMYMCMCVYTSSTLHVCFMQQRDIPEKLQRKQKIGDNPPEFTYTLDMAYMHTQNTHGG